MEFTFNYSSNTSYFKNNGFKVYFKLKACVRYFLSNFYFTPNNSPSNTMKNVFYFI